MASIKGATPASGKRDWNDRSINRSHAQTGQQSTQIHKGHSLLWRVW